MLETKTTTFFLPGYYNPYLPLLDRPWANITLDFVICLPTSESFSVILTIVNHFSKAAHFIPLKKLPSVFEPAQFLLREIFRIHGLPTDIVSDSGPQFISQLWK